MLSTSSSRPVKQPWQRSWRRRSSPSSCPSSPTPCSAFSNIQKHRAEARIVSSSPFFFAHRTRLVELAAKRRLPGIHHQSEFVVDSGGLLSYGPDFRDLFRRSAAYVDKILEGAKPGDLPAQQPVEFELVINRKTAQALGLTIARPLLVRADKVIE